MRRKDGVPGSGNREGRRGRQKGAENTVCQVSLVAGGLKHTGH